MHHKGFEFAKNPKYDGYKNGIASKVYKYFDEKSAACPNKSFATDTGTRINSNLDSEK